MATAPQSPPMADPAMAGDEAEPMDSAQEESGELAYEICIRVNKDGTMSVGVESADQEAAEEQASGVEGEPGSQTVDTIKKALTLALEIYKADGQMPQSGDDAQADFESGFTGKKTQPPGM